jgi:hypothetical protein
MVRKTNLISFVLRYPDDSFIVAEMLVCWRSIKDEEGKKAVAMNNFSLLFI